MHQGLLFRFSLQRIASDSLTTTSVYEYDAANEQTKMRTFDTETAYTDMDFTYDDWGRMITRAMGGHTASFEYRFGDKLKNVASDFPDEDAAQNYNYDGLGKLRVMQDDYSLTWSRWDAGWNMSGIYGGMIGSWAVGDLGARFTPDPASMGGAPLAATLDPLYSAMLVNVERDRLGSLRRIRLDDAYLTPYTQREYGPYGETYSNNGMDLVFGYTGHQLLTPNSDYPLFYAPFRMYSPNSSRWTTRDPLGFSQGQNLYGYVGASPLQYIDPMGLDRQLCVKGHAWLSVDTYNKNGHVNGQVILDFGPGYGREPNWQIHNPNDSKAWKKPWRIAQHLLRARRLSESVIM